MRRILALALLLAISLAAVCLAENQDGVELSRLTQSELEGIVADVDSALDLYHSVDFTRRGALMDVVKMEVTDCFAGHSGEIGWAWVDYGFTRDWDFYTLTTHIDYRDENGAKQKPGVYAELLYSDGRYEVYYLRIGTDDAIDRRSELPETYWSTQPRALVNSATGLDFSTMEESELEALKASAEAEISASHAANSTVTKLMRSLVELEAEKQFARNGVQATWSWFDYDYTCDWDFYTMRTTVSCRDSGGKRWEEKVYAEAYPMPNQYALCYLCVGEDVLVDRHEELPEEVLRLAEASMAQGDAPRSELKDMLSDAEFSAKEGFSAAKDALTEGLHGLGERAGDWFSSLR